MAVRIVPLFSSCVFAGLLVADGLGGRKNRESHLGAVTSIGTREQLFVRADQLFWEAEWAAEERNLKQLALLAEAAEPAATSVNATAAAAPTDELPVEEPSIKSPEELSPTCVLLQSFYDQAKDAIKALNAHNEDSKVFCAYHEEKHKNRTDELQDKLARGELSEEFIENATKDEDRMNKYFVGVCERQEHQYHTALDIQHGIMSKTKKIADLCNGAVDGSVNATQMQEELKKIAPSMIVFMQGSRLTVKSFCSTSLSRINEMRAAAAQAQEMLPSGM